MTKQTLVSAFISLMLVLAGLPLVEYIRGRNLDKVARAEKRAEQIRLWETMISNAEFYVRTSDPDFSKFLKSPEYLTLCPHLPNDLKIRIAKVKPLVTWSHPPTHEEVEAQRKEFFDCALEMSENVALLQKKWLL